MTFSPQAPTSVCSEPLQWGTLCLTYTHLFSAAVEGGDIDEDTLELVCANSGAEELETLCAAAEADKAKGVDAVEDAVRVSYT